jgi:predicted DNA-binding transcriptional regulator AlpA
LNARANNIPVDFPPINLVKGYSIMQGYSTREAARKLGISFTSMNRYIAEKKLPVPKVQRFGGGQLRIWTDADIEHVRQVLPKIANGRKTRYKKQSALGTQQSAKTKTPARVPVPHKKRKTKKK